MNFNILNIRSFGMTGFRPLGGIFFAQRVGAFSFGFLVREKKQEKVLIKR